MGVAVGVAGVKVTSAVLLAVLLSVTPVGIMAIVDTAASLSKRLPVKRGQRHARPHREGHAVAAWLPGSTLWLMAPDPLAVATLAPMDATAVQLSKRTYDENVSTTVAPVTADGPSLLTVMVYVVLAPKQ